MVSQRILARTPNWDSEPSDLVTLPLDGGRRRRDYCWPVTRASGGIGRRGGFRFLCPKGCAGSSPASPTFVNGKNSRGVFWDRVTPKGLAHKGGAQAILHAWRPTPSPGAWLVPARSLMRVQERPVARNEAARHGSVHPGLRKDGSLLFWLNESVVGVSVGCPLLTAEATVKVSCVVKNLVSPQPPADVHVTVPVIWPLETVGPALDPRQAEGVHRDLDRRRGGRPTRERRGERHFSPRPRSRSMTPLIPLMAGVLAGPAPTGPKMPLNQKGPTPTKPASVRSWLSPHSTPCPVEDNARCRLRLGATDSRREKRG